MSMIERVADTLVLAAGDEPNWSRERYLSIARGAIEAMREPTEEMIRAGYRAYGAGDLVASDDWLKTLYGAMIDEALVVHCGAPRMIIEPPPIEPDTRPTVVVRRAMRG